MKEIEEDTHIDHGRGKRILPGPFPIPVYTDAFLGPDIFNPCPAAPSLDLHDNPFAEPTHCRYGNMTWPGLGICY